MKEILLNGDKMLNKASTHAYLKQELALPDYYGENLDALWDCLTTDFSPKKIIICKPEAILEQLEDYGEAIINLFEQAAEENENIKVYIERDNGI
ncbi:barstar family protein [Clostridium swellfunianum]|uniref:barstar family protein n=1 Tax=Clostridium swellfunianum TaxID=1367462 RepID=UPI00202EAD75|nr:barstar family protein [Clostridium swellfunianum]MCM0648100.1 barstar family protein [Clostridium swellfunianum]